MDLKLNDYLASVVRSLEHAIISIDQDGNIIYWSKGAEQLFNLLSPKMLGKSINTLNLNGEKDFIGLIKKIASVGKAVVHTATTIRKDGSEMALLFTINSIYNEENKRVGFSLIAEGPTAKENNDNFFINLLQGDLEVLVTVNEQNKIVHSNESFASMLGIEASQLVGKKFSACFSEPKLAMNALQQISSNGFISNYPLRINSSNGKSGEGLYNGSVYKDKQGKFLFVFATMKDKEGRKKSEDKFKSLLESAPDAIVIVNNKGKIQLVNSQTENLFGFRREEIIGKEIEMLMPSRYRNAHHGHRNGFFGDPKVRSMGAGLNLFGQHKEGHEFPVEISLSPIETDEGLLISAAIRDVSSQKKAQEELQKSNERFFKIFEHNPVGMIISHLESKKFQFVNNAFADNFGYSKDEVIGKTSLELNLIDPASREKIIWQLALNNVKDLEMLVRKKNGETFWSLTSVQIIIIAEEKFALTSFLNITERKKAEMLVLKKTEELTNSNQELEQFAYVASHDLQEPLRTIANFSGLIERKYDGKLDEDASQYIHFIVNAVSKMQGLIKDLLEFSRIGRDNNVDSVDCNEIVKDVIAQMNASIEENKAEISFNNLPIIMGYKLDLKRLFLNLLGNAIKFQETGQIPKINISVEENVSSYIFSVRDNGIGIKEKALEKLFVIFQRLNDDTEFNGTGIGLAICKKIANLHGGKIWVESKFGEGSTFHFSISKKI